jgi:hypothetical protein
MNNLTAQVGHAVLQKSLHKGSIVSYRNFCGSPISMKKTKLYRTETGSNVWHDSTPYPLS